MTLRLHIIVLILGLLLGLFIMRLVVIKKVSEKNALLWVLAGLTIILVSSFPNLLTWLSMLVGVYYPPAFLFLIGIMFILFIIIQQSAQITNLEEKNTELTQLMAILNHRIEGDSLHIEGKSGIMKN